MTVKDRFLGKTDALIIATLSQACALPQDVAQLKELDDTSLILSLMQSAFSVSFLKFNQVCHFGHRFLMLVSLRDGTKMPGGFGEDPAKWPNGCKAGSREEESPVSLGFERLRDE